MRYLTDSLAPRRVSVDKEDVVSTRPLNKLLWWCNLVLGLASWIVPQRRRLEWRREWDAEVWHWCHFLVESGRLSVSTEQDLLRHCWGAFADALWHRFNRVAVVRFVNSQHLVCPAGMLAVSARATARIHGTGKRLARLAGVSVEVEKR
jgi:hypothetical protein